MNLAGHYLTVAPKRTFVRSAASSKMGSMVESAAPGSNDRCLNVIVFTRISA